MPRNGCRCMSAAVAVSDDPRTRKRAGIFIALRKSCGSDVRFDVQRVANDMPRLRNAERQSSFARVVFHSRHAVPVACAS
ncbi:hypothetical protein VL15_30665 [Burkholderia cepacia]|uniref:Uncharacterized protein n=1 Tax=Burkholderia cepacia TaxID=292 RepID=A0A0J5WAD5_BURCE|nr:hypothetical protein VL15_30665 [Burkholderia cepacia]